MQYVLFIILLCLAGPLIGSLIGVLKKPSKAFLFNLISFAAGVMIAISFLQLIPESLSLSSVWICGLGILSGAIFIFIIDKLIPHLHPSLCSQEQGKKLEKTAIFLLLGIFIHNFPEGMAIGIGGVSNMGLSFSIALAIALHDIPEAICTSAPYYYVSRKKLKSFLMSMSTVIPTIMGFLLTFYLLKNMPLQIIGFLVAATAGIMIYISSDELIPTACSGSKGHSTIFSLILGILLVLLLTMI